MLTIAAQNPEDVVLQDVKGSDDWLWLFLLTLWIGIGLLAIHDSPLRTTLLLDHSTNTCRLHSDYLLSGPVEHFWPLDRIASASIESSHHRTGTSYYTLLVTTTGERINIPNVTDHGLTARKINDSLGHPSAAKLDLAFDESAIMYLIAAVMVILPTVGVIKFLTDGASVIVNRPTGVLRIWRRRWFISSRAEVTFAEIASIHLVEYKLSWWSRSRRRQSGCRLELVTVNDRIVPLSVRCLRGTAKEYEAANTIREIIGCRGS